MKQRKSQFFLVSLLLLALSLFILTSFFRTTDTASVTLFVASPFLELKNIQSAISLRNDWSAANSATSNLCSHLESVYSELGISLDCALVNYFDTYRGNYSVNFTAQGLEFRGYIS